MNSIVELSLVIQPCFYILKEPTILEFTYLHIFISFLKVLNGNRPICIFFATISMPKFATIIEKKILFLWWNILI